MPDNNTTTENQNQQTTSTNGSSSNTTTSPVSTASNTTTSTNNTSTTTRTAELHYLAGMRLYEEYAKLDDAVDQFSQFNTNELYQIFLYLVPNFTSNSHRFHSRYYGGTRLLWQKDVRELYLNEKLYEMGVTGSALLVDDQNGLSHMLEQFTSYDFVINITQKIANNTILRYESYVTNIVSVSEVEQLPNGAKLIQVKFEDVIISFAKRHSIKTIEKFNTDIKNSHTFFELYVKILKYIASIYKSQYNKKDGVVRFGKYIQMHEFSEFDNFSPNPEKSSSDNNTTPTPLVKTDPLTQKLPDNTGAFRKLNGSVVFYDTRLFSSPQEAEEAYYEERRIRELNEKQKSTMDLTSQELEQKVTAYQSSLSKELPNEFSGLIKVIFEKSENSENTSIHDLLKELAKVACEDINPNQSIMKGFETMGAVSMPLFLRDEYPDMSSYYFNLIGTKLEDIDGGQEMSSTASNLYRPRGTTENVYMPRILCARNFAHPFAGAFLNRSAGESVVFECFTGGEEDKNAAFPKTMMGTNPAPIRNVKFITANADLANTRWKNIAFVSSNPQGESNMLILFNWMYEYFNQVLLDATPGQSPMKMSNILPNFYLTSQNTYDPSSSEHNAYVFKLKDEKSDPRPEMLMQIGKSIASLVLLNHMYSFETEGNLLRRPNEIINIHIPYKRDNALTQTFPTDFMKSENTMVYVSEVIHCFTQNTFIDKIVCNRIYEQVKRA